MSSTIDFNASNIPYYDNIINSDLYNVKFINYRKRLIIIGILYLIISIILKTILNKVCSSIKNYIDETENRNAEISRQNDLIMQEKREIAKNTHMVKCPYCGANNVLTSKVGLCNFCRKSIE